MQLMLLLDSLQYMFFGVAVMLRFIMVVCSLHLTLLDYAIDVEICLSVCPSVYQMHVP